MTETTNQPWWRGEFLSNDAEMASHELWQLGAAGVEIRDRDTFFEGDPDFAPVPDGQTRLIAYFECETPERAQELEIGLHAEPRLTIVSFLPFEDRSWETKWHEFFKPRQLSPRTIIGPPWESFEAPQDGHRIIIQPGMAFGTGTHETTQLVSQVIDDLLRDHVPQAMLDVGSGSGVLCILAAKLGVSRLLGLELEEFTLENARENVELNGLLEHDVTFSTTPLAEIEGEWPLVVANIIAPILLHLRPELIAHTEVGGELVLSGILDSQMESIREAFSPQMQELGWRQYGDWCAIHYRRNT